jgi:hypothetical protein
MLEIRTVYLQNISQAPSVKFGGIVTLIQAKMVYLLQCNQIIIHHQTNTGCLSVSTVERSGVQLLIKNVRNLLLSVQRTDDSHELLLP